MKLLVANRGEIAIRILRAASELNIPTVAIYPGDDAGSLHTGKADEAVILGGMGRSAYLDIDQIVAVAIEAGCDAIHPGCGFLAENAEFARRCAESGLLFVGPRVETLELLTDTQRARAAAAAARVPTLRGAGDAEESIRPRRRVGVQILGDSHGGIAHLGERDCSVQRHLRKVVEVAPAPGLSEELRARIIDAAMRFAGDVGYTNAGTFEFLVDVSEEAGSRAFAFIEANARLQVGHTVTEEVTEVDIVKSQIRIAEGATIAELGLDGAGTARPRGYAIQARVCMESVREDGSVHPTSGTLDAYEAPSGPGVRTDGFGYGGYETSLLYDTLLAKVIGHSPSGDLADAVARTGRALAEFRVEGVDTNIPFLRNILAHEDFGAGRIHTRFVDEEMGRLAADSARPRFVAPAAGLASSGAAPVEEDEDLPIGPDGSIGLATPIQGTIVVLDVDVGEVVRVGQRVAVVEAMKLQHDIKADRSGVVCAVSMSVGDVVREGYPVVFIEEAEVEGGAAEADGGVDLGLIRDDLRELNDRIARTLDDAHADAVAARHRAGRRTARENVADLVDEGSFHEFGPAASGSMAGGTVIGLGTVNADLFGEESARVALIHNDWPIATITGGVRHPGRGAQGSRYRQEPIHELVHDFRVPLVLFSEGEGRPFVGPHGFHVGVGMDGQIHSDFARLSGLVPLVGVTTGHCFGANATMLACCDVIIATGNAAIGMGGGPAVVQASGMGSYTPLELGSMSFQARNGNVDIVAPDDAAAVATARKYLSYFQGAVAEWEAPDQRRMRHIIPENRVRTYDMREIVDTLADVGSVLEIRREFGIGVITAFIRIEGRPVGLIANNPAHLAGAVDSPGADKGARFQQLCDAFDIPVVVLMDCPGIMVGPEHERTALVRHSVRMFNVGANLTTAMFGVIVRKAYGLGLQAMCGGSAKVPFFSVAWPTAEFAGMNIEGAVKLSARRELAAIEDPEERKAAYDRRVAQGYETARAVNAGPRYVIDPAQTRAWIARGLKSLPPKAPRTGKKRPYVDTW